MMRMLTAATIAASALLLSSACSCRDARPPTDLPVPNEVATVTDAPLLPFPIPETAERFTGTLRIDAEPGGKRFQGVWFTPDGAEEAFLIAYRAEPIWVGFEGQRVEVAGERYSPEGQAIMAPHLRVLALWPADGPGAGIHEWLGPRTKLQGRFVYDTGDPGSKSEGERWLTFQTDSGTFLTSGEVPDASAIGRQVEVTGRRYEPSRFITRLGGNYLWVANIGAFVE